MNLIEDKLHIKIVALDEIYNFVVVFELKLFRIPKYYCKGIDFEIWNLKLSNNSEVDMVYTTVIVLNRIYNFVVESFKFDDV